ncbi:helix-turn-helix domain-containing protein [Carnobacterium inhibens]|uniref:helix-turn-helix domain-containing protein n=1 Tax=Carnobacterium inhibens TaxID=147709 RepID=UPI000553F44F|nr:helix-turn-helix domain-containing protein [Carnobacterium inhibens]
MKVEHFLEKNEVREVTIFKQLVLNGGKLSYVEMLDYLAVAKASLDKDLESISFRIQSLADQVSVSYDGQYIFLTMSDEFSLQQIYQLYLSQSVKVKLISFLFEHQEFSIIQLAQQLMISDSSLFRKIKELNSYLKEFGIKIRNGKLHGEELNIRYFYFQFYSYIEEKEALVVSHSDKQITQMVQAMESFLHVTIEPENRQRLNVWMLISKNRVHFKEKKYTHLREQMQPYLEDPLHQKIRLMVLRYFSRYSIEVDEEEAMLHFAFLLAFPILNEHDFHEYTLERDRRAPIATLDTYVVETIIIHYKFRRLPYMVERDMYYHLSHIHTKLYFFQGDIEVYDYEEMLSKEKQFTGRNLVSFAHTLLSISTDKFGINKAEENSLVKMELLKYISLLAIISFKMTTIIQIGIDLKMESIYTETLNQLLILNMRHINGIHVEACQPNKVYDLILTNEQPTQKDRYGDAQVYVLSEILSSFDMENIQRIVQQLNV